MVSLPGCLQEVSHGFSNTPDDLVTMTTYRVVSVSQCIMIAQDWFAAFIRKIQKDGSGEYVEVAKV